MLNNPDMEKAARQLLVTLEMESRRKCGMYKLAIIYFSSRSSGTVIVTWVGPPVSPYVCREV